MNQQLSLQGCSPHPVSPHFFPDSALDLKSFVGLPLWYPKAIGMKWTACYSESNKNNSSGAFVQSSQAYGLAVSGRVLGSIWQGIPTPLTPAPFIHPEGCYTAAIQCLLYVLCLAKHLEPMSHTGLWMCHTVFFKRTEEHALVPNPPTKRK